MKDKIFKKIFLFIAIGTLLIPSINVIAEEVEPTASPEPTESPEPTTSPSPSPTPTPSETPEKEIDAVLDGLTISEGKWDSSFSSNDFDYEIIVNSKVSGIVVSTEAHKDLKVTGDTGSLSLTTGTNTFAIQVTNEKTSKSNTYTIKVIRATDNLKLKSLRIKGQNINEVFEATTYDYTADITYNVESITVQAAAEDANATVTVSGSSNLKVGRNTIKVIVKNQAGDKEEYRIIVTRGTEEELLETEEDDENSGVESSDMTVTSQVMTSTNIDDDTTTNSGSNDTLKYILIVVFCIILLIIAGLGIFFYVRSGNSEKRKQKRIEKLKRKQEKINQELTGLLPIIVEEEYEEETPTTSSETKTVDLEDTIELDVDDFEDIEEEKEEELPRKKRVDKNVLEDFDDLFLDE